LLITGARQPAMVDALRSVELMRPRRSTVPFNATAPPPGAAPVAPAVLSLDEVTRDIEDIGWRECPVGSLLSVRAGMRSPAAEAAETPIPLPILARASSSLPPAAAKRKRSRTGKAEAAMRRRVLELLTLPSVETVISA
jgi:hypothetical protein